MLESRPIMPIPDSSPRAPSLRERLTAAVGLAAICALFAVHAAHFWFLTDDAFIYFRYSRHLAEGLGPVFNPGERVEGYTGVLWLLLLTGLGLMGIPPEIGSTVMGFCAGLATLVLVFDVGRRLAPARGAAASLTAPLILATNRTFAAWATGGLETSLFTLLVVAAFRQMLVERADDPRPTSGFLFALATLTRPEGVLFFGSAVALRLYKIIFKKRSILTYDLMWILMFGAPVCGHLAFRLLYYGYLFPNTFYAKVPGFWWAMGAKYLAAFALEYALFLAVPIGLLAFLSRHEGCSLGVVLPIGVIALPYLAYVAAIGGDHFEFRFLHAILPGVTLLVQEGAHGLYDRIAPRTLSSIISAGLVTLYIPAASIIPLTGSTDLPENAVARPAVVDETKLPRLARLPGFRSWFSTYNTLYAELTRRAVAQRVEEHRHFLEKQIRQAEGMREMLDAGVLRPTDTIALGAMGVIPYYTALRTIDVFGLTDAAIAHQEVTGRGALAHEKRASLNYLFSRGVDFVATDVTGFFLSEGDIRHLGRASRAETIYLVPWRGQYFSFVTRTPEARLAERFRQARAPLLAVRDFAVRSLVERGPAASGGPP